MLSGTGIGLRMRCHINTMVYSMPYHPTRSFAFIAFTRWPSIDGGGGRAASIYARPALRVYYMVVYIPTGSLPVHWHVCCLSLYGSEDAGKKNSEANCKAPEPPNTRHVWVCGAPQHKHVPKPKPKPRSNEERLLHFSEGLLFIQCN